MLIPFPLVGQEMNCKETLFIQEVIPSPHPREIIIITYHFKWRVKVLEVYKVCNVGVFMVKFQRIKFTKTLLP